MTRYFHRAVRATVLTACLTVFAVQPASAQWAVMCVNCSQFISQLMQYAGQLTQMATAASQLTTEVSQYQSMVQNLQTLPSSFSQQLGLPDSNQMAGLQQLATAAQSLYSTGTAASGQLNSLATYSSANNMTPTQWLQYLGQQAQQRGGVYQQALNDNNQRMVDLQKSTEAFQQAAANAPNLQGNLQGLSQLNSQAAAAGQIATEMLSVQRQALAQNLQSGVDANNSASAVSAAQTFNSQSNQNIYNNLGNGLKASKALP